jgi:predicted alpha/beta-hydrolase family hydrolase
VIIATERGPAEAVLDRPAGDPVSLLVLGHGAGGGIEAPDLLAVRDAAVARGVAVARVLQPYRVAGRRAPAPAAHLDVAWVAAVVALRAELGEVPLIVGGRSSGARVACRTAVAVGAAGVVALAFPLHAPGRPERSRAEELPRGVPTLVVNGERDPFGVPESGRSRQVVVIAGADHSLRRSDEVATAVVRWLSRRRWARATSAVSRSR